MQQISASKTPATDLLELLCRETIEQYYHYEVRYEKEYTTVSFFNKENLSPQHSSGITTQAKAVSD